MKSSKSSKTFNKHSVIKSAEPANKKNESPVLLLVDDEPKIINALCRELNEWSIQQGVKIVTAGGGREALDILRQSPADLIITDQRMPGMSGSEMLKTAKKWYPDIISILLTGHTEPQEIIAAVKAGVLSYIVKPWDADLLKAELENAYEISQMRKKYKQYVHTLEEELKWGGMLQRQLLDFDMPQTSKLEFSISYHPLPNLFCGGDYYDIITLLEGVYLILVGDVAGHGIKGAFVTAMLKSMIYRDYIRNHKHSQFSPAAFLTWLNNRLVFEFRKVPDLLVTFSAVLVNIDDQSLVFSNAGHIPLILFRNNSFTKLHVEGPGLGFLEDMEYKDKKYKLLPEDLLICYTDGLIEKHGQGFLAEAELFAKIDDALKAHEEGSANDRNQASSMDQAGKSQELKYKHADRKDLGGEKQVQSIDNMAEAINKAIVELHPGHEYRDDVTIITMRSKHG